MIFLFLLLTSLATKLHAVTVETTYGRVQGQTLTLHNEKSVNTFLGVPFAKPPVGPLRFMPPENPDPWSTPFFADTNGPACPQEAIGVMWLTHPLYDDFSEDCLHMNIYAPAGADSTSNYPVMFYIHGGAYSTSANIQYPGHFLAMKDVVVVVTNYRLGVLGFAYSGDSAAPGNQGLLDQIKALEFVKFNIQNFGGDPNKITIFGQSAGAGSSGILTVSPRAQGLFHQVILHSGSEAAVWAVNPPESNPENYIRSVAQQNSCPTADSTAMMECLRGIDYETLINQTIECTPGFICLGFAPVVDGPDGVLPEMPLDLRQNGAFAPIPMISGQTTEDASPYALALDPDNIENGYNRSEFRALLRNMVNRLSPNLPPSRLEDIFEALSYGYSPWPHIEDRESNRDAFTHLATDVGFGITGDTVMKMHAEVAPTYSYVWGYRPSNTSDLLPEWMGTFHMLDVPIIFGFTLLQLNENVRDETEILIDVIDWNEEDMAWTDYTTTLWTNFAKYGKPAESPIQPPGDNEPVSWPEFSNEELNYINLDRDTYVSENYRQKEYPLWTDYLLWMITDGAPENKEDIDVAKLLPILQKLFSESDRPLLNRMAEIPGQRILEFMKTRHF